MGRLERGKDGTQVEPLLTGHMKDVSLSPPEDGRKMRKKRKRGFLNKHYRLLVRILKVLTPYYSNTNPRHTRAWFLSFLLLVLLVAETLVLVYFSIAQKELSTSLNHKDARGFWRGVKKYGVVVLISTPVFSLSFLVRGWLILDWRRSLIKCFTRLYFHNENYYRLKCLNVNAPGFRRRMDRVVAAHHLGDENQGGALDTPCNPIDNPDARICQDVKSFTKLFVEVSSNFVGKSLNVVTFFFVLLHISKCATLFAVFYSVFITILSVTLFSRRLTHLAFERSKKEANFRYGLVRVKEHAEEVAFYRGGERERLQSDSLFQEVVGASLAYLMTDSQLQLLQNWAIWCTSVVPYIAISGRYLNGDEEFGIVTQTVMSFRMIVAGISYIAQNVKQFADIAAEADRLHFLMAVLEDLSHSDTLTDMPSSSLEEIMWEEEEEEPRSVTIVDGLRLRVNAFTRSLRGVRQHSDNRFKKTKSAAYSKNDDMRILKEKSYRSNGKLAAANKSSATTFIGEELNRKGQITYELALTETPLAVQSISVHTPDGSTRICSNLSFTLNSGESLLVEGDSGCGKSSLLRCLAGLWRDGSGTIYSLYSLGSIMFVPQKPYMPLGTLLELILYPEVRDFSRANEVEEALAAAGLSYIIERSGGLSSVRDWSDELSVGEQQRVGFARLFLTGPSLAVLDESTSALEVNSEAYLYKETLKRCTTVVSVGHKSSLYRYHTHVLYHRVDQDWRFMSVNEYRALI